MQSNNLPIVEVGHGIANNFGDRIEINKHLRKYPKLLKQILDHEYSHTTNAKPTMHDFKLDFLMPQAIHYKELFKFMIKHPKSLTQLLPVYWIPKKGFVFDFNLMVMYLIMLGVFMTTIYVGVKYL